MEPALVTCSNGHSYYFLNDGSCPYCKIERNKKWIVICMVASITLICLGIALLFFTDYPLLAEISIVGVFVGGISLFLMKKNKRLRTYNELCIGEIPMSPTPKLMDENMVSCEKPLIKESYVERIITVGRSASNDMVVNDFCVSRNHCHIVLKEGSQCFVVDLNSRNGTFVNGDRVTGMAPVKRGDIIRIGNTTLGVDDIWEYLPPLNTYRKGSLYYDQVELTEEYKAIIDEVEERVDKKLKRHPLYHRMGYFSIYEPTKKRLLKDKYGIDWRTPSELNPKVMFD